MIQVVHPGSRIRILTFYPTRITDSGSRVKKAPDSGPGSAKLYKSQIFASTRRFLALLKNIRIFWKNLAQSHTVIV
jgi:hypothetical protein